ncbi:unnamed protein product [Musa acuminata subsp. malaccensis]|uniref:(wild Malaysian banana) hypothetical protein n=1 Tax=Musa acuminata subsp. malaccensis TaxID=214687 RepID=A0A804KTR1_MUSAM|nr:unnamed protein product [Musa acuminata subsp. malaccensis]
MIGIREYLPIKDYMFGIKKHLSGYLLLLFLGLIVLPFVFNGVLKKTSLLLEVVVKLYAHVTTSKRITGQDLSRRSIILLLQVLNGILPIFFLQQHILMINVGFSPLSSKI